MSKTDDIIKTELSLIGDYKDLKRRFFIGSSNYDQYLWSDGGLTFGYQDYIYGSNDFAWYKEEEWKDTNTGKIVDKKPIIVIEGTHCLNTKSYGTAQLQRFHHAYGAFMNGIISVYYLKKGKHDIRHDLLLAAYFASKIHRSKGNPGAYLVTEDYEDIKALVKLVGDFGETSEEVNNFIELMLEKMKKGFLTFYVSKRKKYTSYEKYLNDRCIFKTPQEHWIKYLGPKKNSVLDASIRYGHIVLGEALVTKYLLKGENLLDEGEKFYYFFPLINNDEYNEINNTLTKDKEWLLLANTPDWIITTSDELVFENASLANSIIPFRELDLNINRKNWNVVRRAINSAILNGSYNLDIQ